MLSLPSCFLVFDTTALLTSQSRSWQEFNRVGSCYVPSGVTEAMKQLSEQAADSTTRETAREFGRFFPTSGWRSTQSYATHPSLKPAEGHEISSRARLSLAIAQAAYGLARSHPEALIVLVSNDKGLLQRLEPLDVKNVCGISLDALVLWSRSQRRPSAISHQLQVMRVAQASSTSQWPSTSVSKTTANQSTQITTPVVTATPARTQTFTAVRRPPVRNSRWRSRLSNTFYNLLILAGLGIATAMLWQTLAPASFNRLWQELPFHSQPTKPAPR
jgi:hypothetical protein